MHVGDYFFPAIVEKVDGVTSEIDWISSEVVGSFVYHVRVSRFVSHAYAEYIGRESEERSVYIPEDFLYRILPLAPDDGGDTESEEEDEEPEQGPSHKRKGRSIEYRGICAATTCSQGKVSSNTTSTGIFWRGKMGHGGSTVTNRSSIRDHNAHKGGLRS